MRWDRERFIAHNLFEFTGREMFCELFGPIHVLKNEWRSNGVPENEIGMTAFDWDYVPTSWYWGRTFAMTGIEPKIIEDTPEYTIGIDNMGRKTKLIKGSATNTLPLDHPVKCADDWEKIKHWYKFTENRINIDYIMGQIKAVENGNLALMGMLGGFDEPRQLMGEEYACTACYEEPELIHDMLDTFSDMAVKVIERVGSVAKLDCLHVHEDMAGKSGPLWGPKQVDEFIKPYYLKVWDAAKAYGAKLFSLDSDGDISPIVGNFIDSGINVIHPIEPTGKNDIVELRKKYGKKVCLKGGIDKFALFGGKEAVRKELEYRLDKSLMGGGTIFGLDHQIPNGVDIEVYKYYINLGREMLNLEPISGEGWGRMAF